MLNANLPEFLRFLLGSIAIVLTCGCIPGTIKEYRVICATYPHDQERQIVALSWIRAACLRMLTAVLLASSGWLLMLLPDGQNTQTFERQAIAWGWVLCAAYVVVQALWARWDRHRIRRLRP